MGPIPNTSTSPYTIFDSPRGTNKRNMIIAFISTNSEKDLLTAVNPWPESQGLYKLFLKEFPKIISKNKFWNIDYDDIVCNEQ